MYTNKGKLVSLHGYNKKQISICQQLSMHDRKPKGRGCTAFSRYSPSFSMALPQNGKNLLSAQKSRAKSRGFSLAWLEKLFCLLFVVLDALRGQLVQKRHEAPDHNDYGENADEAFCHNHKGFEHLRNVESHSIFLLTCRACRRQWS